MKRKMDIVVLGGIMAVVVILASLTGAPARAEKGNVAAVASEGSTVCDALKAGVPGLAEAECSAEGGAEGLVAVHGGIPSRVEQGQAVILKTDDGGKVMAKVARTLDAGSSADVVAEALLETGANVLWVCSPGGAVVLLKAEKEFAAAPGAKVEMKVRAGRRGIEGC